MANGRLAQLLGGQLGLQPSPSRSAMVQQLLQRSAAPQGSGSVAETLNIASKPIMAALLARREEAAQRQQAQQSQQALSEALGLPQPAQTGLMDPRTGEVESRETARLLDPQQQSMQDLVSALSGGQAQALIGQVLQQQVAPQERESRFAKPQIGDFTPESISQFDETGDPSVLVPREDDEPESQGAEDLFSRINPADYTSESVKKFQETKDFSVLEPRVSEAGEDLSSSQRLAAGFAVRTRDAGDIISVVGDKFTGLTSRGAGFAPQGMKSDERQIFEQASRDFINATLRRESGAAIATSEFDNANQQYIPQPGDSAAVLTQKKRNRETISQSLQLESSGAFDELRGEIPSPVVEINGQPMLVGSIVERNGLRGRVEQDGSITVLD